jgi:stage III sporulation protein AH
MKVIQNIETSLSPVLIIIILLLLTINLVQVYAIGNIKDKYETDFFLETRKTKNEAYAKELLIYKAILDSPNTTKEIKHLYSEMYLDLADKASIESQLETTLKSMGFKDILLYLNSNTAEVIVRNNYSLSDKKEQLIKDTIRQAVNISTIKITRK